MFGQHIHLIVEIEIEPCDFLKIWPFEPHFHIKIFLIRKQTCIRVIKFDLKGIQIGKTLSFALQ